MLTRRLIENDILVVVTGCAAVANGKAGQMVPEAAEQAGPGLKAVCKALGIPPVLHMGSCVVKTRASWSLPPRLPITSASISISFRSPVPAPEWYSEKAVSIGAYVVASGIYTVLGVQPPIFGSRNVVKLLADGLEGVVGAKFAVEPDPEKAAVLIRRHIESKRKALGLPHIAPESVRGPEQALHAGSPAS